MIRASVRIDSLAQLSMDEDGLKNYVLSSLTRYISAEISKQLTIHEQYNPMDDSTTYTGTYTVNTIPVTHTTSNNITVSTMSGFNGTTGIRDGVQKIFRVVEYTKNGKVSRVELQQYSEEDDSWTKVPRIQIEE